MKIASPSGWLALLVVAAMPTALARSQAPAAAGSYQSAAECAQCHKPIHSYWSESEHSRAAKSPLFLAGLQAAVAAAPDKASARKACVWCHAPTALASGDYERRRGLKPRARVVATANIGDCPTLMLNAPVPAARKVLAKAGLRLEDIDLFEINEAFAVVAEKFIRDLKLDRDKVNVNGGAIALGHPIGATGAVLIGTILDELERRDLKRGLVTMCAAGGMAPAIIIERV